jgi:hypothetical protein
MRSFDGEIAEISVLDDGVYCVASYGTLFPVSVACKGNKGDVYQQ